MLPALPDIITFLERTPETSLFLLSNIRAFGTHLGDSPYSGNLKAFQQDGRITAVFCLTRGGSLLAQTGRAIGVRERHRRGVQRRSHSHSRGFGRMEHLEGHLGSVERRRSRAQKPWRRKKSCTGWT